LPRRKSQKRASNFGAAYNPYIFLGLTNLLGFVAIYYAAQWLENVKAMEWLAIPAVFLFANFVEYNFNITFPIWDWVKGTVYRRERQEK
jgi:hypothetical protein